MFQKLTILAIFIGSFQFLNGQTAATNAAGMGKGINFSGYEYGNPNLFSIGAHRADMTVLKNIGVKTIRLPLNFANWYDNNAPYNVSAPQNFAVIDSFVQWATEFGFKLIIDNHTGNLTSANLSTEPARTASIWKKVAAKYGNLSTSQFFFELYNEPNGITTAQWKTVAQQIIDSIRVVAPNHSIITGGANYNGLLDLQDLGKFTDNNIIYTFHFYDPFIFTHQGASWVGNPVSTTGIPYPYKAATMPAINSLAVGTWGEYSYNSYNVDGNDAKLLSTLQFAKNWSSTNGVPIFCGEFGSYNYKADEASRCKHMKGVRTALESYGIPYCWWEFNSSFSFFTGTATNGQISTCFQDAWGLTNYATLVTTPNPNTIDFQTAFPNYYGFYGTPSTCTNAFQVVINPHQNGINTSTNCGKFTKCAGSQGGAGVYLGLSPSLSVPSTGAKKLCMKVYYEQAGNDFRFFLSQGNGNAPLWGNSTTCCINTGEWQEKCINLTLNSTAGGATATSGNSYSQLDLFFDVNFSPSVNQVYYFDDIVLKDQAVALPIHLTQFAGRNTNNNNDIKWQTASEENALDFVLERSATGLANSFSAIATVKAVGNSSIVQNYNFTDKDVLQSFYYRLKQNDVNGDFEYSKVISITRSYIASDISELVKTIYPNPTDGISYIVFDLPHTDDASVVISDMLGKNIFSKNYTVLEGYSALPIPVSELTSGVYSVTVGLQNGFKMMRLVKQ